MINLKDRTVIVTGGAGGIGAGIAEVLAEAGASVVIADIDAAKAAETASALTDAGHKADHVEVNLAEERSVIEACAKVLESHGAPWALVNNAGLQHRELLLEGTTDHWDKTHDINARGVFLISREIARQMVEAGKGGRIVNVASASIIGSLTKGHAAYASSKSALLGLSMASALELIEHQITVNTVLPGGVVTPGAIGAQGPVPEGPACRPPPMGLSEPRDIGAAVAFFVSPAAQKITNQVLAVDAGWSLS